MALITTIRALRATQRELVRYWQTIIRQQAWHQRGVKIAPCALVRLDPRSILEIGAGTVIGQFSIVVLPSDPLAADPQPSNVVIGRRVAINEFCNIRAAGSEIRIGDGCLIAQFVSIIGTNHSTALGPFVHDQPWDTSKRGVALSKDLWLGTHAAVLLGVNVGAGSITPAGVVVTKDVPDNAIVAGVPAMVIRYRSQVLTANMPTRIEGSRQW